LGLKFLILDHSNAICLQATGAGKQEQKPAPLKTRPTETDQNRNNCGIGKATQAQCRALYALTKIANYSDQDVDSLLGPLSASTFQDLSRESALQLITYLQTQVAA
jgi:hypothetical protein